MEQTNNSTHITGPRWYLALTLTAIFAAWVTAWDLVLYYAGLLPGNPLSGSALPPHLALSAGVITFWGIVQINRWGIRYILRLDTYAGYILIVLGSIPIRLFLHPIATGIQVPALLWLLIGLVLIGKLAIWVFWYRYFLLRGFASTRNRAEPAA